MNEFNIGLKLKELRKSGNMTLQQVTEETALSVAMLSQIENGNVTPSLKTLLKLASHYRISMGSLFQEDSEKPGYTLVRGSERKPGAPGAKFRRPRGGECSTMAPLAVRDRMRCYLMEVVTDTGIEKISSSHAETFLYVIDGKVELTTDEERSSVEAGDSIYLYDAARISVKPLDCTVARLMRIEAG